MRLLTESTIASGQIAARLTLDQLQQGVNDWRLATAFSAPPELLLRAFRELATGGRAL